MKALALALLVSGCTEHTDLLPLPDAAAACSAPGPPIQLGVQAPCAGALAAQLLRYAVCSCSALVLTQGLYTEGGTGLPMHEPPMAPMAPLAAVGTDESLQIAGPVQVAGALEAAGAGGATFSRTSGVLGTLRSGGPVSASRFLTVGGDAFIAGDVLGRVVVGDVLHVPRTATIEPSVLASDVVRGPIVVAPPCGCAAGAPLDVGALVAAHASANDDRRIGLDRNLLTDAAGAVALDLPCGEFYLSSVHMPPGAELELRVLGRTALFVGGAVTLGNGLRVSLAPNAELDLVATGDLTVQTGMVGAPAAASVRLWLGSSTVQLGAAASLSAAVYAPAAVVLSDRDLTVTGALYAQGLSVPGDVNLRYDEQLLSGGASCGAPPQAGVQ